MNNVETFISGLNTTKLSKVVGFEPTPLTTLEEIFTAINGILPLAGKKLLDFGSGDLRVSLFASNNYDMKCIAVERHHKVSMFGDKVLVDAKKLGLTDKMRYLPYTNAFNVDWRNKDIIFYFYAEPIESPEFGFNVKNKLKDKTFACLYLKEHFNEKKNIYPLDEYLTLMCDPIELSTDFVLCLYTL